MRTQIIRFIGLALVAVIFHGQALASGETTSLTVLGSAVIQNKNRVDGKHDAVNNALSAAVAQAMMKILPPETVALKLQALNKSILEQHQRYIQNFRVLGETASGGTIWVLVQADVATNQLEKDVSKFTIARSARTYPRIFLKITEVPDDAEIPSVSSRNNPSPTEKKLTKFFRGAGYTVISTTLSTSTDNDILSIARQTEADVLITGTGAANRIKNHETEGAEAEVTLQALNIKNGRIMGNVRKRAIAFPKDLHQAGPEALSSASLTAAEALSRNILASWREDQEQNARIEVVISGTSGQIANFVRLRTAISSLSGVNDLRMQEMSGDQVVLTVKYEGSAQALAEALQLKVFNGFSVSIADTTDRSIKLQLIEAGPAPAAVQHSMMETDR